MLISQCVASVPHSHAELSTAEAEGHAARPHFHVHQHSHDGDHEDHHEREADSESPLSPLSEGQDHDSDVVFGADAWLKDNTNSTELFDAVLSSSCGAIGDPTAISGAPRGYIRGPAHHRGLQKCPVFLRTLSIRC